jgi:hypothetical protein
MKFRILTLCLLLSTFGWSQTAPQSQTPAPGPAAASSKPDCPCCQKMAGKKMSDSKDGMACCRQKMSAKGEKTPMSCCKDGKCAMAKGRSCMQAKDGETAACGKHCCGEDQAKGCCMKSGDKAMSCCGSGQCGEGHSHEMPGQ